MQILKRPWPSSCWCLLVIYFCVAGAITACGERQQPTYTEEQLRIVSLSPAITQVLIELGLQDAIVAVGNIDQVAPLDTPSVGPFNDLDLERLITLAPTHVLATTGQVKLQGRVKHLAEQGHFILLQADYPTRVEKGIAIIEKIGRAIGREEKTEPLAQEMRQQLAAFSALTAGRNRPRCLMIFNTEIMMACGPNTVSDELLQIAGGTNAASDATVSAPVYDREKLWALAPEVIFLLMPGEPPLLSEDDSRLDPLRDLDLPAMKNGRVYLLNDPAVLLPGPSMVTTAVSMAVALNPDLAEPIAEVFRESP